MYVIYLDCNVSLCKISIYAQFNEVKELLQNFDINQLMIKNYQV